MSEGEPRKIYVDENAFPSQAMTALRDLLKVIGAGLVAKGMLGSDYVEPLIGAIMVFGPMAWSQYVTRRNHRKLVTTADAAPDKVAEVLRRDPAA